MSHNDLLNNYLTFINSSNQSLHSILEIMNNQQQTFNLLLERNNNYFNHSQNLRRYYRSRNVNNFRFPTNYSINLENLINEFNNDVIVRPTNEEILRSTTRCQFCHIENPINNSCPISHTEFNNNTEVIMINYCKHIFLPDQILHWFQNNVRCPLCRYDIRENLNNNESELELNEQTQENELNSNNINNNNTNNNTNNNNLLDRNEQILRNTLLNTFSQYFNQNDTSMNIAIDFFYLNN